MGGWVDGWMGGWVDGWMGDTFISSASLPQHLRELRPKEEREWKKSPRLNLFDRPPV